MIANMKVLSLMVGLFLISFCGQAQRQLTLKYYQNLDLYKTETARYAEDYSSSTTENTQYAHRENRIALALAWNLKGNYKNEIQLSYSSLPAFSHREITRDTDPEHVTRLYTMLGYEINRVLSPKDQPFQYSLGLSSNMHFYVLYDAPVCGYTTRLSNQALMLGIVPRVSYKLTNHLGIEASAVLNAIEIRHHLFWYGNPQVTRSDSRLEEWTRAKAFPQYYNVKLGLSYRF